MLLNYLLAQNDNVNMRRLLLETRQVKRETRRLQCDMRHVKRDERHFTLTMRQVKRET